MCPPRPGGSAAAGRGRRPGCRRLSWRECAARSWWAWASVRWKSSAAMTRWCPAERTSQAVSTSRLSRCPSRLDHAQKGPCRAVADAGGAGPTARCPSGAAHLALGRARAGAATLGITMWPIQRSVSILTLVSSTVVRLSRSVSLSSRGGAARLKRVVLGLDGAVRVVQEVGDLRLLVGDGLVELLQSVPELARARRWAWPRRTAASSTWAAWASGSARSDAPAPVPATEMIVPAGPGHEQAGDRGDGADRP